MWERIYVWFLTKPDRFEAFGKSLAMSAAVLLVAGAYGNIAVKAHSIGTKTAKSLGDIYPGWPTFLVPESVTAAVMLGIVVLAGVLLTLTGRKLKVQYDL